jgi:hypothetical protein
MKLKFSGSYAKLRKYVSRIELSGTWRNLKHGRKQFRTDEGGILNWWETTGTITFQGLETAVREELEQAFVASAKKRLIGEYRGQGFCGRFRSLYPDKE